MTAIYGHRWVSSYGADDDGDTWLRGLQGVTGAEIAAGLETCCSRGEAWPPSLPEFRALCRPPKDRREHAGMYRDFPKALPPPRDPAKARAAIEAMRRLMGARR